MILKFLKVFTYALFCISALLSPFVFPGEKHKESASVQNNNTTKLKSVIVTIEFIFMCIAVIAGIILINFKFRNLAWVFIIIAIPLLLTYILGAHMSIGIIGNVIRSDNTGKLSADENWAIRTVAYTIFLLDITYKVPSRLLNFAAHITSEAISDLLYITFYVFFLFLYIFFICALLPIPLFVLAKLMVRLNAFFNKKFDIFKIGDYFIGQVSTSKINYSLLIKAIDATEDRCTVLRILVGIFSPIFLAVDVFFKITIMLWILFSLLVGLTFRLVKIIKHTIGKIIIWIYNLSEYRLVATSFRIALIASLTIAVVHNRYIPLFKEYESSTGVFEFVASAILIPVVLEWINSEKHRQQAK